MMSETIWGIIITGVLTLGASLGSIILANEFNNRRLKEQLAQDRDLKQAELDHERDLTTREREMSLRRQVYLAAAEAASAGILAVTRFPNLDIPDEQLTEGYLAKAPSIIKVHIVAKEETVRAVTNFSAELGATFLRLFARRLPLVLQKQQIAFLRGQIDTFAKEQSRMVELMKQYNMDGINDRTRWDAFEHVFDFERRRIEQNTQQIDTLTALLNPDQLLFLEEVVGETIQLGRLLTPALISIRRELELPLDEAEFVKISEEAIAKQTEHLKVFIQQLRSLIATQRAAATEPPPAPIS